MRPQLPDVESPGSAPSVAGPVSACAAASALLSECDRLVHEEKETFWTPHATPGKMQMLFKEKGGGDRYAEARRLYTERSAHLDSLLQSRSPRDGQVLPDRPASSLVCPGPEESRTGSRYVHPLIADSL